MRHMNIGGKAVVWPPLLPAHRKVETGKTGVVRTNHAADENLAKDENQERNGCELKPRGKQPGTWIATERPGFSGGPDQQSIKQGGVDKMSRNGLGVKQLQYSETTQDDLNDQQNSADYELSSENFPQQGAAKYSERRDGEHNGQSTSNKTMEPFVKHLQIERLGHELVIAERPVGTPHAGICGPHSATKDNDA